MRGTPQENYQEKVSRIHNPDSEENGLITVDWNIGNTCNRACSYCHPMFHKGNLSFPNKEHALRLIDLFSKRDVGRNREISITITGGEPTQWDALSAVSKAAREAGMRIGLLTNGDGSEALWRDLATSLSAVSITLHDISEIENKIALADLLRDSSVAIHFIVPMPISDFDARLSSISHLQSLGFSTEAQILYRDHARRREIFPYTGEQLNRLFPKPTLSVGNTLSSSATEIAERRNSFTGWTCSAGIDRIVIDPFGDIWRGWCRVGGRIGNISDAALTLPVDETVCTKATCDNPADLAVSKYQPSA